MKDLFGQALVPASPSQPLEHKAEAMTSDISGLAGFGSSASVALTLSLANRLREQLGSGGSTEYSRTWKMKTTPRGRRYWAHTASGRRISGSDFGGWPTPDTNKRGGPQHPDKRKAGGHSVTLQDVASTAMMTGWPTPMAGNPGKPGQYNPAGNTDSGRKTVEVMAGWATPRREDSESTGAHRANTDTLTSQARTTGWATPSSRDWKDVSHPDTWNCKEDRNRFDQLGRQAYLSSAETENTDECQPRKPAQLNPLFSLWLMLGHFAIEWGRCAEQVTRSVRSRRRSS